MSQPSSPNPPPKLSAKTSAKSPAGHPPKSAARSAPRVAGAARDALVAAARAEFDEAGFEGTDTNRIARRAGYAPQTFYRHFADKTAIFVEIYHLWIAEEWKDLEKAQGRGAVEAARILLGHHVRHRKFRGSLRRLTTQDETVRAARAASRRQQLERLKAARAPAANDESGDLGLALLLCIERIADAAADGELADLGLTKRAQEEMLADVIRRLSAPSAKRATPVAG